MSARLLVATSISRVFEPVILFLILFVVVLLRASLTTQELLQYFAVVVVGVITPTVALLLYAVRTKKISNWDISDRKQRIKALLVFLILLVVGMVGISLLGNVVMIRFFQLFLCTYVGFFLITLLFKISGHMTVATWFVGSMIYWFGGYTWILIGILPFLAWSRVALKRHTVFQVITGTIYGVAIIAFGIYAQLL